MSGALSPAEACAVAWCAAADVAAGITTDDAGGAMRGWLAAAYRASVESGRAPDTDAIVRAQLRAGGSALAIAYARERSRILAERISAARPPGAQERSP